MDDRCCRPSASSAAASRGLASRWRAPPAFRCCERITAGYIALFQGTPLLMQLFVVYYGLALSA